MNTPGFNAEASLYRSNASYSAAGVHLSAGAAQVAPSQTLVRGFPRPWAKCCGPFSQFGGRIYCIYYQPWSPGQTCTCEHLADGEPHISCRPWVIEGF
jgi:hypothetical protein